MIRFLTTALAVITCCPAFAQAHDWLIDPAPFTAKVEATDDALVLSNGLVARAIRLAPNAATVSLRNLQSGQNFVRGVKPEARVVIDGKPFDIGGLTGQPNYAYLAEEWLENLKPDPNAFQLDHHEIGKTKAPFDWSPRYGAKASWPAPGASATFHYSPPADASLEGLTIRVHYEIYDGIPLIAKWIEIENTRDSPIHLNAFTSEVLAVVEPQSSVERPGSWRLPNLHVETDYSFGGMDPAGATKAVHWVADPQYDTQVNYVRETPNLLECRPGVGGPDIDIASGETWNSFRTYELLLDGEDRERTGLAKRGMYRTIAPWAMENPIFMHVRSARPRAVRTAIDQCAEVGFEMVIMTFGSGLNMENDDPKYLDQIKELVDYAHDKGIALGGYSLLASRSIDEANDAINAETGKPGGMTFGNSPCLCSEWGEDYFRKMYHFIEYTGFDILEHDGSYPGDQCASTSHPGHVGLGDSQWVQWRKITDFYKWCRGRGVYLNVPDWYFLSGSSKTGMGYRETNWSLPRAQQIIHGRQNMYDGTWEKTSSMGWMFVPLVQYHGGGDAATIEPLDEHLDTYESILAQNFAFGAQAAYRGPRLYDTERTKAMVTRMVAWYNEHRDILESDIVHLRRADGQQLDGVLHVNPTLTTKGLAAFFNPTGSTIEETITLPLYYTGLQETANVSIRGETPQPNTLNRNYTISLRVSVEPHSWTWLTIE